MAQLFAGMFKLQEMSTFFERETRNQQKSHHVVLLLTVANLALHLHLVCPTQSDTSEFVDHDSRQMCLVDDGQNIIRSLNRKSNKTRVFDNKNLILRI
jgi:hypothetical protein